MSISVTAASDNMTSTSDTQLDIAAPSGTGGILVALAGCVTSRTISPPAGFTERVMTNDASGFRFYCWTKPDNSESTFAFTISGTFGASSGCVLRLTGATETDIVINTAQAGASDDTVDCPSVTTVAANSCVIWAGFSNGVFTATINNGQTEYVDTSSTDGGAIAVYAEIIASISTPTTPIITFSGFARWLAISVAITPIIPTVAVTGTMLTGVSEEDIVAGGETILLTITNDTWQSGGTFDAQRQNIIDGLDSAQSETFGWNNEVRDKLAVGTVVRTSSAVVTITLSAQSAYNITSPETITITVPAAATVGGDIPTVSPTLAVGTALSTTAVLGQFDPELRSEAWFDDNNLINGWFDREIIVASGGTIHLAVVGILGIGQIGTIGSMNIGGSEGSSGIGSAGIQGNLYINSSDGLVAIGEIGTFGNLIIYDTSGFDGIGQLGTLGNIIVSSNQDLIGVGQLGLVSNLDINGNQTTIGIGSIGTIGSMDINGIEGLIGVGSIGTVGSILIGSNEDLYGTGQFGIIGNLLFSGNQDFTGIGSLGLYGNLIAGGIAGTIGIGQLGPDGSSAAAGTSTIGLLGIGLIGSDGNLILNGLQGLDGVGQFGNVGSLNISGINGLDGIGQLGNIGNLDLSARDKLLGIGQLGRTSVINDLISYWKLDESSGTAIDSHGSNNLTDNGSVGTTTGIINTARTFNGTSQFFSISDNESLSINNDSFTIQAWVKINSKTDTRFILGKWADTDLEYALFYHQTHDRFHFNLSSDGINSSLVHSDVLGSPTVGQWYLIHAWYDASIQQIGISVNAGTPDVASHTTGTRNGTSNFWVGRNESGGSNYWDGSLDEIGFWKRALTTNEREGLYNSGLGLPYSFPSMSAGVFGNLIESFIVGTNGIGSLGQIGNIDFSGIEGLNGIASFGTVANLIQSYIVGVTGVGELGSDGSTVTAAVSIVGVSGIGSIGIHGNLIENGIITYDGTGQLGDIGSLSISGQEGLLGTGLSGPIANLNLSNTTGLTGIAQLGSIINLIYQSDIGLNASSTFGPSGNIAVSGLTGFNAAATIGLIHQLILNGGITVSGNGSVGIVGSLTQSQKAGLLGIAQLLCEGNLISVDDLKYIEFALNINRSPSFTLQINRGNEFTQDINQSLSFNLER